MNVANKGIIHKLTIRFFRASKMRNIIAIIAIVLTSLMFTSVFTLGGNILSTFQDQTMRQVGTRSHGGLKYLTMEQYNNFAQSSLIKDISYRRILSAAENELLVKKYTEIGYAEDKIASWFFSFPSTGNMPKAINEIATNTIVLDALGIPHKLGEKVPIEFSINGVKHKEVFILSGFWKGDPVMMAQQAFISKEYVDNVIIENIIADDDHITGTICADIWFNNSFNVEDKILKLIEERGYADGEIDFGVNWAYVMSGEIELPMIAIMVLILTLILLSGYLIIYSVFTISVKTDIHFYGLLKTIGTTGKQIRKIVRNQALILSMLGIPIGLLFGYIGGACLTPVVLSSTSLNNTIHINSTNPMIFIFAATYSLLTIFIGCRKPGKIASKVSSVEAVKYSTVTTGFKKKAKKTRKVTPLSMAWSNITREKRKLCTIVLSLSLALILLNSAFSASRSLDMDTYMSSFVINDFSVTDTSILNPMMMNKEVEGIKQDILDELEATGITEIGCIYYDIQHEHELSSRAFENFITQFETRREFLERYDRYALPYYEQCIEEGWIPTQVYGVGQVPMDIFYSDYDRLASGNYALSIGYDNPIYDVGDTITLTNKEGKKQDFEIITVIENYPYSISVRYIHIPNQIIVLADNTFTDFFNPSGAMYVNFNTSEEKLLETESWLAEYTSKINPSLKYTSRETLKDEFEDLQTTYITMGSTMAFILALVGILNFINTIVASIIARRLELAMLQSVGMTGKQLRSTLFFEGICYTILTMLFTFTIGLGICLMIVRVVAGNVPEFNEYLTIMPSVYCIIPLFLICSIVPLICYNWLMRESLVERLRID